MPIYKKNYKYRSTSTQKFRSLADKFSQVIIWLSFAMFFFISQQQTETKREQMETFCYNPNSRNAGMFLN